MDNLRKIEKAWADAAYMLDETEIQSEINVELVRRFFEKIWSLQFELHSFRGEVADLRQQIEELKEKEGENGKN